MDTQPEPDPLAVALGRIDRDELQRYYDELAAEIDVLTERLQATGILLTLAGRDGMRAIYQSPESERPGLADAILLVMYREDREGIWNAERLLSALEPHGWAPHGKMPRNSVAATLSRLRSMGKVERVGSGDYRLAADKRQGSDPATPGLGAEQMTVGEGG